MATFVGEMDIIHAHPTCFARANDQLLSPPRVIQPALEKTSDGEYCLAFQSDLSVQNLYIQPPTGAVHLSKNYFDGLPRTTQMVPFQSRGEQGRELGLQDFTFFSLVGAIPVAEQATLVLERL